MVGDCVINNRSNNCGNSNHSSPLTQSPNSKQCAANKELKKGPGYSTVYNSDYRKVELSEKTLRVKVYRSEKEMLYMKVLSPDKKRKIEFYSENWKLYPDTGHSRYWILEQRDANEIPTGIIKIVLKAKSHKRGITNKEIIVNSESDWAYYARRSVDI